MSETEQYLYPGDVVASQHAPADAEFVVFDPHPPGSISKVVVNEEGQERLALPGTPAEGVENLRRIGGRWAVERAVEALGRSLPMSDELEALVRTQFGKGPYKIAQ